MAALLEDWGSITSAYIAFTNTCNSISRGIWSQRFFWPPWALQRSVFATTWCRHTFRQSIHTHKIIKQTENTLNPKYITTGMARSCSGYVQVALFGVPTAGCPHPIPCSSRLIWGGWSPGLGTRKPGPRPSSAWQLHMVTLPLSSL